MKSEHLSNCGYRAAAITWLVLMTIWHSRCQSPEGRSQSSPTVGLWPSAQSRLNATAVAGHYADL